MAVTESSSAPPSFLERAVGLSLDEFLELTPAERSDKARAAGDLHTFVQPPLAERDGPARTLELARALVDAVASAEARAEVEERVITDALLRAECDRDQNVYLGPFYTRRLSNSLPDVVFLPASAEEVAAALRVARERDVAITLRGAATSAMGGAVPGDGGIVLDLSRLDGIDVDAPGRRVTFGPGTRMRPLHAALREERLALPVYPSNLGGTYVGWLVTGGIGMNAYGRGYAIDPVVSATVVLPDGQVVELDRDSSGGPLTLAELAGSEGQFGVVVSVTVELEELPVLAAFLLAFDERTDALAAIDWIGALPGEKPADVKLLSASHMHHVHAVWGEEDGKEWKRRPGVLATDGQLPWSSVLGPAELGAPVGAAPQGATFLFVDFLSEYAGRAFAAALAECPGRPVAIAGDSERFARDRFRPMQSKRFGPGMLAAEIVLRHDDVHEYLPAAERLAGRLGPELDAEVYYLSDGTALCIAAYLCDHRDAGFFVELSLAPALLDLAMRRFGGKPYVLGRWQALHFRRKFDASEAERLVAKKKSLDPSHVVGRGAFFALDLRGVLGKTATLSMAHGIRLLRMAVTALPWASGLMRKMLSRTRGVAAGRGAPAGTPEADATPTARAMHCVNCGECNSVCPIFQESRVRLPQMLTHVGEGTHAGEAVGESGSALLDLCMRCGNCEEVCQAGIPHLDLYGSMQERSNDERPHDRERHVLLLERLRGSRSYVSDFLDVRPGGYLARKPAALPGLQRFLLLRAENDAGPAATCIHCAACVDVCPTGANREFEGEDPRWITTHQESCIGCGTCVEVCPANLANGGQTLRVIEAPTTAWFDAMREFGRTEA